MLTGNFLLSKEAMGDVRPEVKSIYCHRDVASQVITSFLKDQDSYMYWESLVI